MLSNKKVRILLLYILTLILLTMIKNCHNSDVFLFNHINNRLVFSNDSFSSNLNILHNTFLIIRYIHPTL
jgi:hypothetical protein